MACIDQSPIAFAFAGESVSSIRKNIVDHVEIPQLT